MSFLRSSGLNAVIVIVLSLSWVIPAVASGVFILKNIEINSNDESKHVRLEFDGEFSGEPLINFESGSISIRFDSSLELTSMFLRTKTPDAPAGIIQLIDKTIIITALSPDGLRKLII